MQCLRQWLLPSTTINEQLYTSAQDHWETLNYFQPPLSLMIKWGGWKEDGKTMWRIGGADGSKRPCRPQFETELADDHRCQQTSWRNPVKKSQDIIKFDSFGAGVGKEKTTTAKFWCVASGRYLKAYLAKSPNFANPLYYEYLAQQGALAASDFGM